MYETDVATNYCSCLAWKFQRRPPNSRDCKHLIKLRGPLQGGSEYQYVDRPKFHLLAQNVPTKPLDASRYVFSRKFDGIRVQIRPNGDVVSRAGVVLPIKIRTRSRHPLDAELCVADQEGHARCMEALDRGDTDRLVARVFDYWPSKRTTFEARYHDLLGMTMPRNVELVAQHRFGPGTVQKQLVDLLRDCEDRHMEGVVVRSLDALYRVDGKRSSKEMFKSKP